MWRVISSWDHDLAVVEPVVRDMLSRFDDRVTHFTGAVATLRLEPHPSTVRGSPQVVSGLVQLLEPAIVGSAIRPPAYEPRRLPEPSAALASCHGYRLAVEEACVTDRR
jgi:hypothetical protein